MACRTGLGDLSLQPLAARVGMTKSGLYAHFGSKQALEVAVLAWIAERFDACVVLPAKAESAGLGRLEGIFRRWLDWPRIAGLPGRCPFFGGLAAFEGAEGGLVREHLQQQCRAFLRVIEELAASAARRGQLPPDTDPAQLAYELFALRQGHDGAARFMGDPAALQRTWWGFEGLVGGRPQSRSSAAP